jgi:nitrite reductase/ring-hydroxylating ferredoxin subunit
MAEETKWVRVAGVDEIGEGEVISVQIGDEQIAIYHMEGGDFRATDNICTHEYACLSDGWLEDGVIECPLHAGRFDVRTGEGQGAPIDKNLRVYPARVEGGDVLIQI